MQLGRVVGTLVATQKHGKLEGAKLLLVQPLTPRRQPRGAPLLTIDSVGAGVGEKVLVVIEGRAAGEALRRRAAPVDAAIIGIVDHVDHDGDERRNERPGTARAGAGGGRRHLGPRLCPSGSARPGRRVPVHAVQRAAAQRDPEPLRSTHRGQHRRACIIEPSVPCNHWGTARATATEAVAGPTPRLSGR